MGIAVAGTILVDRINEITAYPREGELSQIKNVKRAVGGCVPNVGIDLARVDPSLNVYAIGAVGNDDDGKFLIDQLKANNVDTSLMQTIEKPTSFTDVMSVMGGQRTFFTYPGACAEFGYDSIDYDSLNVKMLHLGYLLLLEKVDNGDGKRILKKAKEMGIATSLDMVSETGDRYSVVKECLPYVDNLIINELEAGMLCGIEPEEENLLEIAKEIKKLGVRDKVIIHMKLLSVCYSDEGFFTLPAIDIPKELIKGKTGAGDAFCAGALLGIYRGYSSLGILEIASKCAVASLTEADSISGMRTEKEIDEFCRSLIKE